MVYLVSFSAQCYIQIASKYSKTISAWEILVIVSFKNRCLVKTELKKTFNVNSIPYEFSRK